MDYTYDLVGKIQQVNDPTGTYAFAYDNMGRLIGTGGPAFVVDLAGGPAFELAGAPLFRFLKRWGF